MRIFQILAVVVLSVVLSGCVAPHGSDKDKEDSARDSVASLQNRAGTASTNSQRVALLLNVCGSPACLALKTRVEAKVVELNRYAAQPTYGRTWIDGMNQLLREYQALKAEAYQLLIDSGVSSQNGPSAGYWDATFWDISSP